MPQPATPPKGDEATRNDCALVMFTVVSVYWLSVKVAVTLLAASIVTATGLAVPLASPLHPLKVKPLLAVAVKVTTVPWAKIVPDGLLAMLPAPVPAVATVSVVGASNAPMSHVLPCGRVVPRWSVARQVALSPASIARLEACRAWVWVLPPLSAKAPKSGSEAVILLPPSVKVQLAVVTSKL